MTCSKRWAKPVLPATSCLEPTSYQRLTADDRRQVVLGHDDAQAVGEALVAEHDLRNGGWHAGPRVRAAARPRWVRLATIVPPPAPSGSKASPGGFSVDCLAMSPHTTGLRRRRPAQPSHAALLVLLLPVSASAHSELQSSDPAQGTVVPSPFSGPIVMTFTESLAVGSKADLYGPGHQLVDVGDDRRGHDDHRP